MLLFIDGNKLFDLIIKTFLLYYYEQKTFKQFLNLIWLRDIDYSIIHALACFATENIKFIYMIITDINEHDL